MKSFIIVIIHNNSTDDNFYVFPNTETGKKEAEDFFDTNKEKFFPKGSNVKSVGDVIHTWGYGENHVMYMEESSN